MQREYLKEQIVREKNEDEINQEIIKSLIETKQELNNSHNNLKYADPELIDYYSYKISYTGYGITDCSECFLKYIIVL